MQIVPLMPAKLNIKYIIQIIAYNTFESGGGNEIIETF